VSVDQDVVARAAEAPVVSAPADQYVSAPEPSEDVVAAQPADLRGARRPDERVSSLRTEDEVELTIIPGAPPEEPEKVTVPPEEPAAEGDDDSADEAPE